MSWWLLDGYFPVRIFFKKRFERGIYILRIVLRLKSIWHEEANKGLLYSVDLVWFALDWAENHEKSWDGF